MSKRKIALMILVLVIGAVLIFLINNNAARIVCAMLMGIMESRIFRKPKIAEDDETEK